MKYHQSKKSKHDDRITVLKKVEDKFIYDGINYPTTFDDITKFEDLNEVSIFVYGIGKNGNIVKERNGNYNYRNNTIMLLLLEDGENSHYVYIKDISKLLCLSSKSKDPTKQHCLYCGNHFPIESIDKHTSECYKMCFDNRVVKLPEAGSTMKFKNHKNKIERPFAVYADCEAALKRLNEILNKKIKEGEEIITTKLLNRHDVNSCCYYFVCNFDPSKNYIKTFEGEDCIYEMLKELKKVAKKCIEELKIIIEL